AVSIKPFVKGTDSVGFSARLIDVYNDGSFTFTVRDTSRLTTSKIYEIPGFTIKAADDTIPGILPLSEAITVVGRTSCRNFELINYGKFPHTFYLKLSGNNPELNISTSSTITLQPGERDTVQVCFLSDSAGIFLDTLTIGDECIKRAARLLRFQAKKDDTNPDISSNTDSCAAWFRYDFTDSLSSDYGLERIEILDSSNCDFIFTYNMPKSAAIDIRVRDLYQDTKFSMLAVDSAGHETKIEKFIPGFTVSFMDNSGAQPLHDFGSFAVGSLECDSIRIYNYGSFKFTIDEAFLAYNINYSLPQSQFPIIIMPGDTAWLQVCFRPLKSNGNTYRDTLIFYFNCLDKKAALEGMGDTIFRNTNSRCNVPLKLTSTTVPSVYFIEGGVPSPAIYNVSIIIGLPENSETSLSIFDSFGSSLRNYNLGEREAGIYGVDLDVSEIPSGIYFLSFQTPSGQFTKPLIIEK
ncbi:MAG: C-terminal target protein, partial [Bacteroidota bacterium]|nr:C-terminal target protein [Bacteroidota bacterium]